MDRKRRGALLSWGIVALLAVLLLAVHGYGTWGTSILAEQGQTIEVRPGEAFSAMAHRLAREGVLRNPRFLRVLAGLRGDTGRIKAGQYVVQGRISPNQLLDFLVAGKGELSVLTIPEGYSLRDIANTLAAQRLGSAEEFLRLTHDPAFIAKLDLPFTPAPTSLEGLLFPDTYFLYRGVNETTLVTVMVRQFRRRALPILQAGAAAVHLSPYDALILASIVEKETGVAAERPVVSAVFLNRLHDGMRLASDPTVIYGVPDFDGNLTRAHLRTPTPYNTYTNYGLPPTPIANPGLPSIRAAVAPADVRYLYFVAKGNGTHQFSQDYTAHERAVDRFQRHPHRKGQGT